MKKTILTIFFLLTILISNSQIPDFQWVKQIGDVKTSVANAITTDGQGNVYTTGRFAYTMDFDPGPGTYTLPCLNPNNYNMFILKLDANGNFVWAKSFSGPGYIEGLAIAVDPTGNVYTTGNYFGKIDFDPGVGTNTITSGAIDMFASKLDPLGNFVWINTIGSSGATYGKSISSDIGGNVYITGDFSGTTDFDPGPGTYTLNPDGLGTQAFILKLSGNGNFIWARAFSGTGISFGYSILTDASGNCYTTGAFGNIVDFDPDTSASAIFNLTSVGARDVFISKLNSSGNFVWAKSFGGTGMDEGNSIVKDNVGNIYTTGYFVGQPDFDPGVGTFTLNSIGGKDIFISKLDVSGSFVWAKNMGGPLNETALSMGVDGSGSIYTCGIFTGTTDFDPGTGTFNLISAGNEDIFISRLDASGNFSGAKQLGGTAVDCGNAIAIDGLGNLFVTGYFNYIADFDPGLGTNTLTAVTTDVYVYKMSQLAMTVKENNRMVSSNIYPNPTQDILNIMLDNYKGENLQVEIADILGQVILKENMNDSHLQLNIKDLTIGLYFLKMESNNKIISTQKIIKE